MFIEVMMRRILTRARNSDRRGLTHYILSAFRAEHRHRG